MRYILYLVFSLTFLTGCNSETAKKNNHYEGLKAMVIPKSNFVELGDYYKATIIFNRKLNDDIIIDTLQSKGFNFKIENEEIFVEKKCNYQGEHLLTLLIKLKSKDVTSDSVSINERFIVASPSFYLVNNETATMLNLNSENPLDVSVAGYPISEVQIETDNGTIVGTGYESKIIPNAIGDCNITVFVKSGEEYKKIGGRKFTVK